MFSELGLSGEQGVDEVYRFLFKPLQKHPLIYFCPFSVNLRGKGFRHAIRDGQRMRSLAAHLGCFLQVCSHNIRILSLKYL